VATNDSISWLTTFWYWRTRVANSKGVNKGRFGSVTNAVNGVLECNNGKFKKKARKRFEIYKKVLIAFNVKEKADETGCYN
jgi:predicted chitinase